MIMIYAAIGCVIGKSFCLYFGLCNLLEAIEYLAGVFVMLIFYLIFVRKAAEASEEKS